MEPEANIKYAGLEDINKTNPKITNKKIKTFQHEFVIVA